MKFKQIYTHREMKKTLIYIVDNQSIDVHNNAKIKKLNHKLDFILYCKQYNNVHSRIEMGTNNHTSKEYWMHITKIKKKKNYFHAKATLLLIKNKQANKRDNQA
jgi:hypothetical protein